MANTARWQISSSVLHGLMGSMQSAYRYAQDLNESLNDIRIVTGQSADQMAKFAAQANASAKALSASTVEYTNAALIYYQQGLDTQQVKERTDVTIKMANVSKQSAEVVSDQMTAVWNNFYDGSQSLEHYADVMTALGAATASSADEIAGGLEKFAAIGDTIGLSYEYAASALATITSNTRQSEEVVGTALKTIFARIQGLNLGETLDDGTTLNKYSAALQKIGISIFDSSGEMKRMDDILDEMGSKWETLSKAQQTALAQTVAGTRQYTQLVALMDNWDKGDSDSMKANLATSYGADGALDQQAEIYAESWEAAQDRVKAAAEKIYSALLNDDFFIDMLNGFEKVLGFVSHLIDNLGGLQGVLLALGAIITKVFSSQLSQGLTNIAYNMQMMTKKGREAVEQERRDFIDNAVNTIPQSDEYTTDVEMAQQDSLRTELTLQSEYMAKAEQMSAIEAETNKRLIERTRVLKDQTVELEKQKQAVKERVSNKVMDLRGDVGLENLSNPDVKPVDFDKQVQPQIEKIRNAFKFQDILKDMSALEGRGGEVFVKLRTEMNKVSKSGMSKEVKELISDINQLGDTPDPEQLKAKMAALNLELDKTVKIGKSNIKGVVPDDAGKKVDALTQDLKEQATVERNLAQAKKESAQAQEMATNSIKNAKGAQKQWSDVMVESANVAFSVASAISMVNSAIDTLKDPDVSGMQKLLTVITTMSMVLPTIISLVGTMKKLFSSETIAKIANAAATWAQVAAEKKLNEEKGTSNTKTRKNIKDTWQDTKNKLGQKGKNIKDQWNESALEKRASTKGSGYTKHKNGMYSVKGQKGFVSADQAGKMAGKEALKAVGTKAASVGIAAAGIAVIIGTVAMVVNQLNKAEKAVEKAKAAAQTLSENYDNVKASYDEFINAQSGYETATKSMEELTKGTVEYQEALLQANEAAGELLAKNKNLKYKVVDGKIEIDEDSLAQAKSDELKKMETAQAAKMAGQRQLSEAEMNLKKRDAARDLKSNSDIGMKAGNSAAGGVLGAVGAGLAAGGIAGAVGGGGVFSVPAAIIGAVIGGVAGLVTGIVQETSTDTEQDAIDALAKKAEEDSDFLARLKAGEVSEKEFKELGIKDEGLIASLKANGDQVAELVGEMAANTAAINAQNDLVASNVLADNVHVQESDYKDQIIDIAGDAYGVAYDKALESDWVDTWGKDGISKATGVNDEAEKVFNEYLKYAGLEGQGYELTDTTGTDGNRQFVYKDAEGNEKTVSLEAMQAARAAYEASETLDKSATKLAETFDKLAGSSNDADKALLSFASQKNFEGATQGEIKDIEAEVGDINDAGDVEAYLDKQFGDGKDGQISDETAQSFGYESADAMVAAFTEKLSDAKEAWNDIKLPENFKFADDMSLETAQALEKQIEQMNLGPLGEEAGKQYVEKLNSMLGQLDTEDQQKALKALTAIDWSDWDAMEQAERVMEELGVEIDSDSEEWKSFVANMRMANGAVPDFSKLKSDLQSISGILNKLDFGSVVSDEDYNKLVAYKDEWKDMFVLQADGTRKFIGDADKMREATRENIAEQRKDLEQRKKNVDAVKDSKVDYKISAKSIDKEFGDGKDGKLSDKNAKEHGYKSGEDMINNKMADKTEDLLKNENVKKILTEGGYSEEEMTKIIKEARDGNRERLEAMLGYVDTYMGQDLEQSEKELDEMMASTATSIGELNQMLAAGETSVDAYNKQVQYLTTEGANAAQSLTELNNVWAQGIATGAELDYSIYADNLLRLAESYSICADEATAFNIALQSGNEDAIKAAQENLEASVMLGEAAQKYGVEEKELSVQAKALAKQYGLNAKAAAQLAIENQRMNNGVADLVDNWESWKKELKSNDKTSRDWAKAAAACTKTIANLVGASEDLELPNEFFDSAENMELLDQAAQGSEEAINKLGLAVAAAQVQMMEFQTGMTNIDGKLIDETQFNAWRDTVLGGINDLQSALDGVGVGDNVYEKLGGADWVNALNEMAIATNMSVEQMNSMLNSMGVQAEVTTTDVPQKIKVPVYTTTEEVTESGGGEGKPTTYTKVSKTVQTGTEEMDGVVSVAQINTGDSVGTPPKITYTGNGGVSKSAKKGNSGGGGGGSKAKAEKKDVSKKSDFGERYHTVDKQLGNTAREMEKASKAADKLWSRERLNYLDKQNEKLDEEIELLKQKSAEAKNYLTQDKAELDKAAKDLGFQISYGDDGEILNYDSIRDSFAARMIAAQEKLNTFSLKEDQDEYEKNVIEPLQKQIDAFESAMGLYYDTLGVLQENEDKIQEDLDKKMQNNFDKWSGMLELDIQINERDLEILDYYLSKIEDDVYSMAEAAVLMVGSLSDLQDGKMGGQLAEYFDNLGIYSNALDDLNQKLANGEISEAAYEEGLQKVREGLIDNLSSLNELDKSMLNYYGDTLSMVGEEIDKYSSKMEHQTSILEHYASMMEILGKQNDHDAMGTILQGQADTIKNELDVAEAEYNLYAKEAEEKRKKYEEAFASGDMEAAELYKKEWEAADQAAMEAQSDMLAKTEQWAESMKAVVENKLAGLAKTLEEALTGGTSFDQINTQLERAASLQEEYLTTTNQIYETNKLMRTAQQEIDKTTNSVAKQRLKEFIKETDQLQDKSKLSKYELEIQQAKYDLLLAEIALEEAQNAKSTVRLQRDSEGNFGYVYTADQGQMADAQQKLEDAQNNLYNIGLEGANSYTEKYNQTMQEMYDTLTSITQAYYDGEIASQEEYEAQMLAAQEYYYEQLENFQDLYGVALQADTRVVQDAWSTGMGTMKIETRTWKDAVQKYSGEATATLGAWYNEVDKIAKKTGLDDIATKVKTVTDESDALKKAVIGEDGKSGVVGALKSELDAVSNLTGGYAGLRGTIQGLIEDYEKMMKTVNNAQNQQQAIDDKNKNGTGGTSGDNDNNNKNNDKGDDGENKNKATDNKPNLSKGQSVTVKTTATHFSRDGGNGTRMRSFVPGGSYTVMQYDDDEVLIGKGGVATGWVKKTDLVGFNTGGYTGSWGPYGKLAILDEKELVLNKGDTANFLASMEVLERILEVIDLQSASAQLGGMLHTPTLGGNAGPQSVEQSVHIEASFPGVSDRNEIEEAFNNLINTASQYANRK